MATKTSTKKTTKTDKKPTKRTTKKSTKTVDKIENIPLLQKQYVEELTENPEYSLEPDPTGALQLSQVQKDFIRHYVNFKSIATAAELCNIDADTAKSIFVSYNTQLEIRRINRALCHRQFAAKLVTVDEIGGYLSSLLTGDNVALADQLKTTEKLRVVELLLKLNDMKSSSIADPGTILYADLETQIKQLSVGAIQKLISQQRVDVSEKQELVSNLDDGSLSMEEKSYLMSLPVEELLKLLDENKQGGKENVVK